MVKPQFSVSSPALKKKIDLPKVEGASRGEIDLDIDLGVDVEHSMKPAELDIATNVDSTLPEANIELEAATVTIESSAPSAKYELTGKPLVITAATKASIDALMEQATDKKATVGLLLDIQSKNARDMKRGEIQAAKAQASALMAKLQEQKKAEAELKIEIGAEEESMPTGNEKGPAKKAGVGAVFAACIPAKETEEAKPPMP